MALITESTMDNSKRVNVISLWRLLNRLNVSARLRWYEAFISDWLQIYGCRLRCKAILRPLLLVAKLEGRLQT
jgi:hypothetical protein